MSGPPSSVLDFTSNLGTDRPVSRLSLGLPTKVDCVRVPTGGPTSREDPGVEDGNPRQTGQGGLCGVPPRSDRFLKEGFRSDP